MENVRATVKEYLLTEVLPGEDPALLTDDTPLVTTGILDSIATMKLTTFLEKQFNIELDAHETSADYLDTIASIAGLVESKRTS